MYNSNIFSINITKTKCKKAQFVIYSYYFFENDNKKILSESWNKNIGC